jgi:hypothetical protein
MTEYMIWTVLSLLLIFLIGFIFLYRKLSSVQRNLTTIMADEKTGPFASLLKNLERQLDESRKSAEQTERVTTEALAKFAETSEKRMALLMENAESAAAAVRSGSINLHQTLRDFEEIKKSLKSDHSFLDSQISHLHNATSEVRESVSTVHSVKSLVDAGFWEVRMRAINDQLSTYPRKLWIVNDEDDGIATEPLEHEPGGVVVISARCPRIRFKLLCENDQCQWNDGKSRYMSHLT